MSEMTAYAGLVSLDSGRLPDWRAVNSAGMLDGVGVGPLRHLSLPDATFILRQREVTPEDRLERQPWPVFGGQGALLFDGRLDNREELVAALDLAAHGPIPDGQIAAKACEHWGGSAAGHMQGDFAIALWDGRSRQLHLMRERLGRLPLYWYRQDNVVAFATTLRALLSIPIVPRELDEQGLADFLALNHAVQHQTVYRQIFRVPLAHVVSHDAQGEHRHPYARFDPDRRIRLKDPREYEDAAIELLAKAVRAACRTVAPAPLLGSGGLDSALLAATLAHNGTDPISILTILPEEAFARRGGLDESIDDEALSTRLAAAFPGMQVEHLRPVPEHAVEVDPAALFARGAVPLRGIMNVAWFHTAHARLREMGAGAALTGMGGNATLTWNGYRGLSDHVRTGAWPRLGWEMLHLKRRAPSLFRRHVLATRFQAFRGEAGWRIGTALRPETAMALDVEGRMIAAGRDPTYVGPADSRLDRIGALHHAAAYEADAAVLFRDTYGFMTCSPLLSVPLVEWCLAIPVEQYLHRGRDRWLARRVARRLGVPDALLRTPRRSPQCPEWFTRLQRQRTTIAGRIEGFRKSALVNRLIDVDRLEHALATWPEDEHAAEMRKHEYDYMLSRAAHVGAFIRWVERAND